MSYCLHTLIAIVSEPAHCLLLDGVGVEDAAEQGLRDKYWRTMRCELIQWLVLKPMAMSELISKLYVRDDTESAKEDVLVPPFAFVFAVMFSLLITIYPYHLLHHVTRSLRETTTDPRLSL